MEQFLSMYLEVLAASFIFDFSRYLFGAGGTFLVVWVLFKKHLQGRKIRTKTPPLKQILHEFVHSLKTVFVYSLVGMMTYYGAKAGVMEIYSDAAHYGWLYYGLSLLGIIIAHDSYFYWVHWLMHRPGVMKYIHKVHHKSHNPTPWAAYSFDVFEAATHAAFLPLFLYIVPVHTSVIMIFLAHMIIRNAMGHSGYELFPRSWATHPLFGLMTLVTHHDLHHANSRYNMGLYFSWWDRIMGTEHPDYLAQATGDSKAQRRTIFIRKSKTLSQH